MHFVPVSSEVVDGVWFFSAALVGPIVNLNAAPFSESNADASCGIAIATATAPISISRSTWRPMMFTIVNPAKIFDHLGGAHPDVLLRVLRVIWLGASTAHFSVRRSRCCAVSHFLTHYTSGNLQSLSPNWPREKAQRITPTVNPDAKPIYVFFRRFRLLVFL